MREESANQKAYWKNDDPWADVYVAEAGEEGKLMCPGCCALNDENHHFCEVCGKPLTAIATSDPLGQVYSHGDMYRRLVSWREGKLNWVVFAGLWVLFGPGVIWGLYALASRLGITWEIGVNKSPVETNNTWPAYWIGFAVELVTYIACAIILIRATRAQFFGKQTLDEERPKV